MTDRSSDTTAIETAGDEPSAEDIQRKPWNFVGYKGYADFIASDGDFHIFRRFDALNARLALLLQDEISVLEDELKEMDYASSRIGAVDQHNGSFRHEREGERSLLLGGIAKKLYRYSIILGPSILHPES